jgi:hypothetical protein
MHHAWCFHSFPQSQATAVLQHQSRLGFSLTSLKIINPAQMALRSRLSKNLYVPAIFTARNPSSPPFGPLTHEHISCAFLLFHQWNTISHTTCTPPTFEYPPLQRNGRLKEPLSLDSTPQMASRFSRCRRSWRKVMGSKQRKFVIWSLDFIIA